MLKSLLTKNHEEKIYKDRAEEIRAAIEAKVDAEMEPARLERTLSEPLDDKYHVLDCLDID